MEVADVKRFEELLAGDIPVVCDFFADWCGPCRMLAPVLEKAAEKFADRARFIKVNVDEQFELAARYNVASIPLVCVFKNGEPSAKSLGYTTPAETEEFLNENL